MNKKMVQPSKPSLNIPVTRSRTIKKDTRTVQITMADGDALITSTFDVPFSCKLKQITVNPSAARAGALITIIVGNEGDPSLQDIDMSEGDIFTSQEMEHDLIRESGNRRRRGRIIIIGAKTAGAGTALNYFVGLSFETLPIQDEFPLHYDSENDVIVDYSSGEIIKDFEKADSVLEAAMR